MLFLLGVFAAAAMYMACKETDERRVQRVIYEAAGTTEVTLRNSMKGLNEALSTVDPAGDENFQDVQAAEN